MMTRENQKNICSLQLNSLWKVGSMAWEVTTIGPPLRLWHWDKTGRDFTNHHWTLQNLTEGSTTSALAEAACGVSSGRCLCLVDYDGILSLHHHPFFHMSLSLRQPATATLNSLPYFFRKLNLFCLNNFEYKGK